MRKITRPYADIPEVSKVVPVAFGGFGGKNNKESADALGVLLKSDIGRTVASSDPEEIKIAGPDWSQAIIQGPSWITKGLPFEYVLKNPRIGENTVSIDRGNAWLDGFTIKGIAPGDLGFVNLNVNGRIVKIEVREAKPQTPVLTCVHDGKNTASPYYPMSISEFKTIGYVDRHVRTEYNISDDPKFSRLLDKKIIEGDGLVLTYEANETERTYFFRARVFGLHGSASDWSNTVAITRTTERTSLQSLFLVKKHMTTDSILADRSSDFMNILSINQSMTGWVNGTDHSAVLRGVYFESDSDLSKPTVLERKLSPFPSSDNSKTYGHGPGFFQLSKDFLLLISTYGSSGVHHSAFRIVRINPKDARFGEEGAIFRTPDIVNPSGSHYPMPDNQFLTVQFYVGPSLSRYLLHKFDPETLAISRIGWWDAGTSGSRYSGLSSIVSRNGLCLMTFDAMSSSTIVRTYTRSSLSASFTFRDSRTFSSRIVMYNGTRLSRNGKYLTFLSAPNTSYGSGITTSLYSLNLDSTNYPTWTFIESINSPNSDEWDSKTLFVENQDIMVFSDNVYGVATDFIYSNPYYYGDGRFEELRWMKESMDKDRYSVPSTFRDGKVIVFSDGNNFNISI